MTQMFQNWLCEQDPEATFDPQDCQACAGYQFLKAHGYPVITCGVRVWWGAGVKPHEFPDDIGNAIAWACRKAAMGPVTFGALAERLAKIPA